METFSFLIENLPKDTNIYNIHDKFAPNAANVKFDITKNNLEFIFSNYSDYNNAVDKIEKAITNGEEHFKLIDLYKFQMVLTIKSSVYSFNDYKNDIVDQYKGKKNIFVSKESKDIELISTEKIIDFFKTLPDNCLYLMLNVNKNRYNIMIIINLHKENEQTVELYSNNYIDLIEKLEKCKSINMEHSRIVFDEIKKINKKL